MASVFHLFTDAKWINSHIIEENKLIEHDQEKIHYAALLIQRHGRGYLARQFILRLNTAAIILQKYIRRFLVKINMLSKVICQIERRNLWFYDKVATKIQALWRGYKCRLVNREIFLRKETERLARENSKYLKQAKLMKKRMEEYAIMARENDAKEMVLFILFKLHHLLRTNTRPGILSDFDTSELSWIERLLKSLQFTTYMKELRKVYNNTYRDPSERPCIFKGLIRNSEKAYYQRYRGDELKTPELYKGFEQKKRFCYNTRVNKPYEPYLTGKYLPAIKEITRELNSRLNQSCHDFDITMRKAEIKKKNPDYFINFWSKICEVHQLPEYLL